MARFRYRFLCATVLCGFPALAEAQAVPRGETARGQTVTTRPREDFDPLGVRLGAFRLNAAAELGLGYDDNLLGLRRGGKSDGYGSARGEASLQSDWSRHAVGVTGSFEERRHFRESDFDWRDWSVGAFGRYDVNADTSIGLRYNHVVAHLDTSSIDVQATGVREPVPYSYDEVQVEGGTRFNRIGVQALGNWRGIRYEDVDVDGPPQPPASDPGRFSRNDYDQLIGQLGLTYELSPGRFANVIGRVQDIRYRESDQSGRDSLTLEGLAGFIYDFDGVWQARVAVGYIRRDYEGDFKTLAGPSFEGEVIWQPTLLTTVTFAGRRSIEESIRGTSVSFTRTIGQVNVDHEYLRNVILGAELAVDRREYEQPDEQATDAIATLSARWLINRSMALVGSYSHSRRLDSSAGFEEYDRNLFQLRLRIAL